MVALTRMNSGSFLRSSLAHSSAQPYCFTAARKTHTMIKPNFKTCSEEELWHYVASFLISKNIDTVFVGGAVVSIYSESIYRSGDLDMVTPHSMDIIEQELKKNRVHKEW